MWVYDDESLRFLAVNNAAVQNYGYSREQFFRHETYRSPRSRSQSPRDEMIARRSQRAKKPPLPRKFAIEKEMEK